MIVGIENAARILPGLVKGIHEPWGTALLPRSDGNKGTSVMCDCIWSWVIDLAEFSTELRF
jgi:hypothetical protein